MCKNPRGGFFWWEIIPQIFDFEIFGFVFLSNSVLPLGCLFSCLKSVSEFIYFFVLN